MTIMQKMRSNQKKVTWFLLVPVVIAFTLFGLGVSLTSIFGSDDIDVEYRLFGEPVSKSLHNKTRKVWTMLNRSGKDMTEDEVKNVIGDCILAEKYGFVVTEEEVDIMMNNEFSAQNTDYGRFLADRRLTDEEVRLIYRQRKLREKYSNFMREITTPAASDVYKKYLYQRTNYQVKYAVIQPSEFKEDVIVTDEKLKALYDEASVTWQKILDKKVENAKLMNSFSSDRDEKIETVMKELEELETSDIAMKADITDGPYASVKVISVSYENARKKIVGTVTADSEEVKEYYYANLSKYRKTDIPTPPTFGPVAPAIEKKDDVSVDLDKNITPATKKDEDKDGTENTTETKPAEKITWDEWDGTEFKEYDGVKEDVLKEYIEEKAKEKADEILTEIRNAITQMSLTKYDFSIILEILDEKFKDEKLYEVSDINITPQNAEQVEVFGSTDLKLKAFDAAEFGFSYWKHSEEDQNDRFSNVIDVEKGKYMFFVTKEEPGKIKPFEECKELIKTAYQYIEEKKLAKQRAEDIIASLKEGRTIEDLANSAVWQNEPSTTKATVPYLNKFGEENLKDGEVLAEPIWVQDQKVTGWRVQVLVKVNKPTLADFAKDFESFRNGAKGDISGTRPDQPKGYLGAWQRFDKKAMGLEVEEPVEENK